MADDISSILGRINASRERDMQGRQQKEVTKRLDKINNSVQRAGLIVEKSKPVVNIPSLRDIINGFAKLSPIFNNTKFSKWMGNIETNTKTINQQLSKTGQSEIVKTSDTTLSEEYLDLVVDKLDAMDKGALKRIEKSASSIPDITNELKRLGGDLHKDLDGISQPDNLKSNELERIIDTGLETQTNTVSAKLERIRDDIVKWREQDKLKNSNPKKTDLPKAKSVTPNSDNGNANDNHTASGAAGGMLGAILGVAGMKVLGMLKALPKLFLLLLNPLKALKTISSMVGMAKKLFRVGPLVFLSAIIDFFKGFSDAENILGRGNLSFIEKVQAGLSAVVRGFGEIIDWVMSLFGINTEVGKTLQDGFIKLTDAPVRWIKGIVDWVSNKLFSGIDGNTSLTEIPSILMNNLTKELKRLISWVGDVVSDAIDYSGEKLSEMKTSLGKTFSKYVTNPFFALLNTITGTIFDLLDSIVSIIPDKFGGEDIRAKVEEYRKAAKFDLVMDEPENGSLPTELKRVDDTQSASSLDGTETVSPVGKISNLVGNAINNTIAESKVNLKEMRPEIAKTVEKLQQIIKPEAPTQPAKPTVVQQNAVDNKKTIQTNNFNSQTLSPDNDQDLSRVVWGWGN